MKKLLSILLFVLAVSMAANGYFLYQDYVRNIVVRVPDGDSIDLADGRRIRLLGIDAPEKGRCLADEARSLLTALTLSKRVKLTDIVHDDYGRTLANVWVGRALVNKRLVEEGLAKFVFVTSPQYQDLKSTQEQARASNLGIYSETCRSKRPSGDCEIKGNTRAGKKTYFLPTCRNYTQVIIDESFGDKWFCTEEEARASEFNRHVPN